MGQKLSNEENKKNKNNNEYKSVEVSLSKIKCKYCNKNYIPNKILRSHLFFCINCYLIKKQNKFKSDLNYHTNLEFVEIIYPIIKGIEFIDNNKTILVHCREGVSRSSSIVIAYIMFKEKKTFSEVYNFVLSKKSNIKPNENFMKQLKEFEDIIKACNYDLKMVKEFCRNFTGNKYGQKIEIKK